MDSTVSLPLGVVLQQYPLGTQSASCSVLIIHLKHAPHGHSASKTLSPLAASTIVFSVTGIPVGVIPVTRVDPALDQITEEWKSGIVTADGTHPYPSGRRGSKIFEKTLYEGFLGDPKVYDPVAMEGLPVGIQIAGRWGDDEKVIGLMKVVDDALGERGFGPGSSSQWLKV